MPTMPLHNQKLGIFQKRGVVDYEIPLCSFEIALDEIERLIFENLAHSEGRGLYIILQSAEDEENKDPPIKGRSKNRVLSSFGLPTAACKYWNLPPSFGY